MEDTNRSLDTDDVEAFTVALERIMDISRTPDALRAQLLELVELVSAHPYADEIMTYAAEQRLELAEVLVLLRRPLMAVQ